MSQVVPITDVRPDPKQPRTFFRESALKALATSLKKAGQRQPITVRRRKPGAKRRRELKDEALLTLLPLLALSASLRHLKRRTA